MTKESLKYAFSKATDIHGDPKGKVLLLDALYQEMPELIGLDFTWPIQGMVGHTAFIGDYVLKAPNADNLFITENPLSDFQKECEYLKKLEHISLVPNIVHIGEKFNICVMQRMPGVELQNIKVKKTQEQDEQIAASLAKFTYDVSVSLSIEKYPKTPFVEGDILDKITAVEKGLLSYDFIDVWGDFRHYNYTSTIKAFKEMYKKSKTIIFHNDLNAGNILVDPKNPGEVTGIIDFGLIKKCRLPEASEAIERLGENIHSLFNDAYRPYKSSNKEYDTLAMLKAFNEIVLAVKYPDMTTENELDRTDDLVEQAMMSSF